MIITFEQLRAANFEVTITVTSGRPQCRSHITKLKLETSFFLLLHGTGLKGGASVSEVPCG